MQMTDRHPFVDSGAIRLRMSLVIIVHFIRRHLFASISSVQESVLKLVQCRSISVNGAIPLKTRIHT